MGNKSGQMVLSMKENGNPIKPMAMANLYMQMETYTKDNGKMTRHMAMEATLMQMEQHTLETGKTINNMVEVLKPGLMELNMKAYIRMGKSMAREP